MSKGAYDRVRRQEEGVRQVTNQRQYVGKYQVLRKLGQGGEGNVYLARDAALNRLVAVKKLQMRQEEEEKQTEKKQMEDKLAEEKVRTAGEQSQEWTEQPKKRAEQSGRREQTESSIAVIQEAELLQQLRHPMLPVVYELLEEDGWYLVMEYIQGVTLRGHVERNGYVQEVHACAWTDQLLDVLEYLHTRKPPVIYRDLKPDNIMVCPDGHLRLVDFGAAYRQEFGMVSVSLMAATPGYGAPEQFGRTGYGIQADERSDIYALGKVLYYMVTGSDPARPPYTSLSIRDYQPLLGSRLEQVIQNCIEEEPAKRYQTVGQIRKDLNRCGRKNSRLRRQSFIRTVEKQVWLTEK